MQYAAAASKVDEMIDLSSSAKDLSNEVLTLEHPTERRQSLQAGAGGPGARMLETSALVPRERAAASVITKEEIKNTCFLCATNDRPTAECCIEDHVGQKPRAYVNGHGRTKRLVVCEWFDGKSPAGNDQREDKVEIAHRRRRADGEISRRKKVARRQRRSQEYFINI